MTRQEEVRRFAEDMTILADDYEMNAYPVSATIENIRAIERDILNGRDLTNYYGWLQTEIDEYDGNENTQDHADEAKRLKNLLIKLDNKGEK